MDAEVDVADGVGEDEGQEDQEGAGKVRDNVDAGVGGVDVVQEDGKPSDQVRASLGGMARRQIRRRRRRRLLLRLGHLLMRSRWWGRRRGGCGPCGSGRASQAEVEAKDKGKRKNR